MKDLKKCLALPTFDYDLLKVIPETCHKHSIGYLHFYFMKDNDYQFQMGIKWKCFAIDCAILYAHSSLQVNTYDNKLTIAYHLLMIRGILVNKK